MKASVTFLHFVTQHVDLRLASAGPFAQVQLADLQLRRGRGLFGRTQSGAWTQLMQRESHQEVLGDLLLLS